MADDRLRQAHPVILYDGVCGLCNRLNRFVLRRDPQGKFRFASLQSQYARRVLAGHGRDPDDLRTLVVITPSGEILTRTRAVRFILSGMGSRWARLLGLAPEAATDLVYDLVARLRYRVFGRYPTCPLPEPGERERFIEV